MGRNLLLGFRTVAETMKRRQYYKRAIKRHYGGELGGLPPSPMWTCRGRNSTVPKFAARLALLVSSQRPFFVMVILHRHLGVVHQHQSTVVESIKRRVALPCHGCARKIERRAFVRKTTFLYGQQRCAHFAPQVLDFPKIIINVDIASSRRGYRNSASCQHPRP